MKKVILKIDLYGNKERAKTMEAVLLFQLLQKVVLEIDLYGDKEKRKAMRIVTSVSGINSISMNLNEKKMTLIGEVDPVDIVEKLRKYWYTKIVSVGPAEDPKKKEAKKEDDKKKEDEKKKQEEKKKKEEMAQLVRAAIELAGYNSAYRPVGYHVENVEEDYPNTCVVM